MIKKIVIIPESVPKRHARALADIYARVAGNGGHTVQIVDVATAKLKACLEQTLRPGDALSLDAKPFGVKPPSGKSARVLVTMGMPAWLYRWGFGAHSLKSLKRNFQWFVGIGPTRDTVIGAIKCKDSSARRQWLDHMRMLGRRAR